MYNPRTVACKTVTVTEEDVCPIPTVVYLDMPEVAFVGNTATCRVTLNTQDGNAPKDQYGGSAVMAWDGTAFVDLNNQIDWNAPVQTVILTWEMLATTEYVHAFVIIVNSCGAGDNVVHQTAYYEYTEGVADITATNLTVTPSACEAPCDISISVTWSNMGSSVGTLVPRYTVNGIQHGVMPAVTLNPGQTHTMADTLYNMPAGSYVICPIPN